MVESQKGRSEYEIVTEMEKWLKQKQIRRKDEEEEIVERTKAK